MTNVRVPLFIYMNGTHQRNSAFGIFMVLLMVSPVCAHHSSNTKNALSFRNFATVFLRSFKTVQEVKACHLRKTFCDTCFVKKSCNDIIYRVFVISFTINWSWLWRICTRMSYRSISKLLWAMGIHTSWMHCYGCSICFNKSIWVWMFHTSQHSEKKILINNFFFFLILNYWPFTMFQKCFSNQQNDAHVNILQSYF